MKTLITAVDHEVLVEYFDTEREAIAHCEEMDEHSEAKKTHTTEVEGFTFQHTITYRGQIAITTIIDAKTDDEDHVKDIIEAMFEDEANK